MARQFVLEGASVEAVVEILPYSSGLARNISQCLEDFDIPIHYSSTVINIKGRKRVEAVTVAQVNRNRKPVPGTERDIECDTLLLSAGLIPENELSKQAGVELSRITKGAVVDDTLQTSVSGIFSCGNVLHVHDLVDHVTLESESAGRNAALWVQGGLPDTPRSACIPVSDGDGVQGVVPQYIRRTGEDELVPLMFRPRQPYKRCTVCIDLDGTTAVRKKFLVLAPGEMSRVSIKRSLLAKAGSVTVRVEVQV
jgi:hypothetical protein